VTIQPLNYKQNKN